MINQNMFRMVLFLPLSFCVAHVAHAFQSDGFKTEAVGVQVFKAKDENGVNSMVMGQSAGTTVTVNITSENRHIIGFGARDNVKLTITDDKGNQLSEFSDTQSKQFMFDVGEDGKSAMVPISGSKVPTKGATQLTVKGTLEIVTGMDERTDESSFKLEEGKKVTFGNIPCKLNEVADSFDPSYKTQIELETNQSLDAITKVEFFDEAGNKIESRYSGGGSFGFGDNYTYSRSYALKNKGDRVKVKVTYFNQTQNIEVPIELTTGLGF